MEAVLAGFWGSEASDDIGDARCDGELCGVGRAGVAESVGENAEGLDAADGMFDTDTERR